MTKMEIDGVGDVNITKRKSDEETPERKMKKIKVPTVHVAKNALQLLNENFGPSLEFTYTSVGSPQSPGYAAVALVNGVSFEGNGTSKIAARRDLAIKALAQLLDIVLPVPEELPRQEDVAAEQCMLSEKTLHDFSSQNANPLINFTCTDADAYYHDQDQQGRKRPTINEEKARSQPTMMLAELFPNMLFDWKEGNGRGDRQFKVEADVEGRRFFGEGRSKKMAKLNLAKTVLLCMYDVHDFEEIEVKAPKDKSPSQLEKKFPVTQLKELIGEDNMNIEVIELESTEGQEKTWHATVVVKGVAYEAIGKNRNTAKIRAAKKALDVLRPKKDVDNKCLNSHGVDVAKHPVMLFYEHYPDVNFLETETKKTDGGMENNIEAVVGGKVFNVTESTKKKAKLRLVINVFEEFKKTAASEWTAIDVKRFLEK